MSKIIIFTALLIISLSPQAQSVNNLTDNIADKINRYLASAVAAYKFNGVALVARKGEVLVHKAYGWRNFENQTYNDTTTIFPILSITKSFTAIVILNLQEENKISIDDKVNKYLPDFPNGDKITIENLITHTSGIYNYTDDIGEEDSGIINHPVAKKQVLDIFYNKPLSYKPGEGFGYNNSGYYLAGIIIEKITGKSWEQNVRELIFDPLAMKNSGFDFNNLAENAKATGYQFLTTEKQKPYTYVDSTVGYSAGSIYSTTTDMYKWTQAIAKQLLLSKKSWDYAFTPKASDYGFGFRINNFFKRAYIKHSGGYSGFVSEFLYYPKEDVTIILLKNTGNYDEDLWPVTMGISSIVFGLPYDLWKLRTEMKLSSAQLREKEGKYAAGKIKVSFRVIDDQLYEILPNGTELPLLAESQDSFYLQNFNTSLQFKRNKKGTIDRVVAHEHGKDFELKRMK
jgi:CubicO group peptidase (beta-lactamase class C family)